MIVPTFQYELISDRPILLTDTDTDTNISVSVRKIIKYHVGIGIVNYKIKTRLGCFDVTAMLS